MFEGLRDAGSESCLIPRLRELVDPLTGEPLAERDLRDEAMTLLLAGHETTANTLAWTFDHLARDPELQGRARAEAREHASGGDAPLGLAKLPWIDAVVSESLRLAPPAWLIMRRALEAHEIGGFPVPRGSFLSVPIHAIHRSPEYWAEPEVFRPERFLEGGDRNPAFLPFGAGPRRCPGEAFARAETRILVSRALTRFRFEAASPPPAALPLATLRPAEHVRLRVEALG